MVVEATARKPLSTFAPFLPWAPSAFCETVAPFRVAIAAHHLLKHLRRALQTWRHAWHLPHVGAMNCARIRGGACDELIENKELQVPEKKGRELVDSLGRVPCGLPDRSPMDSLGDPLVSPGGWPGDPLGLVGSGRVWYWSGRMTSRVSFLWGYPP